MPRFSIPVLQWDSISPQCGSGENDLECLPVEITHRDKIGLIPSFDRLDSDSLNGFGEEVIDLLDVEGSIIDSDCVAAVAEYLKRGVSGLPAFIDFDVPPSEDPRLTSFSEPTDVDQ